MKDLKHMTYVFDLAGTRVVFLFFMAKNNFYFILII